jgi:hypothetical protein
MGNAASGFLLMATGLLALPSQSAGAETAPIANIPPPQLAPRPQLKLPEAGQPPWAPAEPSPSRPVSPQTVTRGHIVQLPTKPQMEALFPERASREGMAGKVQVRCEVMLDQRLTHCAVIAEEPVGYGFGDAGLRAATYYAVTPPLLNGRPVSGTNIVLRFRFLAPAPLETAPAPPPSPTRTLQPIGLKPRPQIVRGPAIRSTDALWAPAGFAIVIILSMTAVLVAPLINRRRRAGPA